MGRRVTLKEVAEAARVSVMTASLALRKQGRISEETRKRVLRKAERLGYRPDPMLAALVHYRDTRRAAGFRSTLAFLTAFEKEQLWRRRAYIREYFDGACERAAQLGYTISPIWACEPGFTPKRLAGVLKARGIKGVMIAPVEDAHPGFDLEWEKFCVVSLCRNLIRPKVNTVDHNHRQSVELACEELLRRGYRRPGFVSLKLSEQITGWMLSSTLASFLRRHARRFDPPVPDLLLDDWEEARLARWYRRHRPDVILSLSGEPYLWLMSEGRDVPGEVGFLHFETTPTGVTTGICQEFRNVGIVAVDMLHNELLRDERGIPRICQSIGIDGYWIEKGTLRPPTPG